MLTGFKENVIMGHLIPAGTGLPRFRHLRVVLPMGAELPDLPAETPGEVG